MPDDTDQKTPEQIAAEAAQAAEEKAARERTQLAKDTGIAVAEALAAREAAEKKTAPAPVVQDAPIEEVDPAEIDRRIKAGEDVGPLLARFGANVEERTRRAVIAQTGSAVAGLQTVLLQTARKDIEHFTEYENDIVAIVNRVRPEQRTLETYQQATAMVLGRPDVRKKLEDARVATELDKVLKRKDSAGTAEPGGASRAVRSASPQQIEGELAPTEENLRTLVGEDSFNAFVDLKRSRGISLDGFAQRLGYPDAKFWFKRMQENDVRSSTEGLGLDR